MNIHLVGNGNSSSYFNRTQCNKFDIVVGCNFSDSSISPDFVCITDLAAMRKLVDTPEFVVDYPAVITDRCSDYFDKNINKIENRLQVLDVIKTRQVKSIDRLIPMNSAQHGLLYAIENNSNVSQVYIWGLDSFWTDNIASSTDRILKKQKQTENPRIAKIWRNYWQYLFRKYSETHQFTIKAKNNFDINQSNVSIDIL